MTMKKRRKRTTSPAAVPCEDRISALPDEVLHCILRRLESHRQSAQTTAISSRWRNLWRSYPVVEFDADWQTKNSSIRANEYLENFCATAINKFSQHKEFFRIETLKVSVRLDHSVGSRSPVLQWLLDLAWQRKVQEFAVKFECADNTIQHPFTLTVRGLSKPGPESIKFTGVRIFHPAGRFRPCSVNSLRSLRLECVSIDDQLFVDLIASSRLLETLELDALSGVRKIQISNNLKTLRIVNPVGSKEIEISAPLLETLHLKGLNWGSTIGLIAAPQLRFLEFGGIAAHFSEVISKLPSLRSLILHGGPDRKVRFSSPPQLEEFKLVVGAESELEEIQVDAAGGAGAGGPCSLTKFVLCCQDRFPDRFRKCQIRNAVSCEWEVDFRQLDPAAYNPHQMFVGVESFVARLKKFQVVNMSFLSFHQVAFYPEKVGAVARATAIKHLKLETKSPLTNAKIVLLDGAFWACRPKFLTIVRRGLTSKEFFRTLLGLISRKLSCADDRRGGDHPYNWQRHLKDAKIVVVRGSENRNKRGGGGGGGGEEEVMVEISEEMVPLLTVQKRVCFMLIWQ
ncbi:unnamed protein product [Linum tenue]|uniref:F-box domain-containing protein n=1 Tax=Linum tenue TaxID=586396 RepID=A0AAV0I4G0_9ROSI|nr:unnamed protein product [Linum tenue]